MDKISVIMPAYNCEKFLAKAIKSVQNQTYSNWELIIVDDASTDNTLKIAKNAEIDDQRIKVIKMKQNSGVSVCRNTAVNVAEGRYLAFLDSDDVWSKNKLQHQLDFMQRNQVALCHTAYAFMNENNEVMAKGKVNVDFEVDLPKYMKTTQIGMSSVMIDHQKINNVHFPEDRELCEDARVWMALLRKGQKFYGLNEVLVLYRIRSKQLSHNKMKMAVSSLKRYWREKNLPAYKRLFYFINYAYNGFSKRLRKNNFEQTVLMKNFEVNKR